MSSSCKPWGARSWTEATDKVSSQRSCPDLSGLAVDARRNDEQLQEWLVGLPKCWRAERASQVVEAGADIVYGIVRPGPKLTEGVPYVRGMDIVDGEIRIEQLLRTSPEIAQRYVPIPLPSLQEQAEVIRRVDLLLSFANDVESRLATARAQVSRLTPALLAKAFRGELVSQNPNDEPASALLARIKGGGAADASAAPRRRQARESVA